MLVGHLYTGFEPWMQPVVSCFGVASSSAVVRLLNPKPADAVGISSLRLHVTDGTNASELRHSRNDQEVWARSPC